MTALQRHVAFFDRNEDGRVTVGEVIDTLRLLGCSNSYAVVNSIGGMLARTTESAFASHEVAVANAHCGKYRAQDLSGETRIFDEHGQFDSARFEEVLARYGHAEIDGLTEANIAAMIEDISPAGSVQRSSSQLAFQLLITIAGERQPNGEIAITRARLRAFYEGDLFAALIAERNGVNNVEPLLATVTGVAVGAVRAICPFGT